MYADADGFEKKVIELLIAKKMTVSTAESCTGGLLSAFLTSVSGASEVLNECIVTYSNEAKMRELGVKRETLDAFGAVSEQTAREMAAGICEKTGADVGISVTGIAGPTGGTAQKPVGTVYIGVSVNGKADASLFHFDGNRDEVRSQTCREALKMTAERLKF
ncbi:MAG: CinA family protein [Firmicutes bacterium]|nr:CinA family protein [Bacillota bacterium]